VLAFKLTESRLTKLPENFRDGQLLRLLNLRINIDKWPVKLNREFSADGGLTRAHESDQIDMFNSHCVAPCVDE
jgi:hypothetical protein